MAWLSTPLGAPQWVAMLASLAFALPLLAPPDWLAQQYRLALTPGHVQGAVACLRGELGPAGQREVFLDELPRLTMPTLVIWGMNDMVIPAYQAVAADARLTNGRLVLLPNCGHLPQVEQPDRFVAALDPALSTWQQRARKHLKSCDTTDMTTDTAVPSSWCLVEWSSLWFLHSRPRRRSNDSLQ